MQSLRPEYHADTDGIERLIRRARMAMQYEETVAEIEARLIRMGSDPESAQLAVTAAQLLGPILS